MWNDNELKDRLNEYEICGSITELRNIIYSNALAAISLDDIISVLSKSEINYVRIGYGSTLFEAYNNESAKGESCKLVHILFPDGGMNVDDLYKFIESLGDNIIFGYSKDETINTGVKLIMIFN